MAPASLEDRLVRTVQRALESSQVDKVTRAGAIITPYYVKKLKELLTEYTQPKEA